MGAASGSYIVAFWFPQEGALEHYVGGLVGAIVFFILALAYQDRIKNYIENIIKRLFNVPSINIFCGSFGFILGLLIAKVINWVFDDLQNMIARAPLKIFSLFSIMNFSFFGYIGFRVGYSKLEELLIYLLPWKFKQDLGSNSVCKILDTSVIIDGRLKEVCLAGFIEGELVLPKFVLSELQHIADSCDIIKRRRGRRGLEILQTMQQSSFCTIVKINEQEFHEIEDVDSKLVTLTKKLKGKLLTNDANLQKIAELQGVQVLNVNELAQSVKILPIKGQHFYVRVIKVGREKGQGIAYLDDGTLVIVERGNSFIGKKIEVEVTSFLQTGTGKMVFAKIKKGMA
ncbi:MAG: hypothetical protein RLZ12_906 [Bacillota bacterium]|jgi:uncharacterized protein YacL